MNLAIAVDWLPVFGGAEHVIAEFYALWPKAPLFTTVVNRENIGPLRDADIRATSLQKWYRISGNHQWLLPWMPRAMESMDLRGFDTILSSSHAIGKGIIPPSTAKHICYCHTPMRYAWEMEEEYLNDFRIPNILRRAIKAQLNRLRRWDMTSAARVDTFIANSTTTQERIARVYNRDSIVIPPPVSEKFFLPNPLPTPNPLPPTPYYLAIGRLVPYKRFDLLVEVANRKKIPLKIAGSGKEFAKLKAMAGPTVTMLGFVQEDALPELYTNAKALLFPQFEDAGVVPMEAQACGTPVIAYEKGGVRDTVKDGETGVYFAEQTVESISDALDRFASMHFDPKNISRFAAQFRSTRFQERMQDVVSSLHTK